MMGSGMPSSQSSKPRPNPMTSSLILVSTSVRLNQARCSAVVTFGRRRGDQRARSTSRMMMGIGMPKSHNKIGMA
jgi:hypothetical protein